MFIRQCQPCSTIEHGVNGLLVDHDARSMATAIERLLADPEYADKFGKNGVKLVTDKWTLDAGVDRLERYLQTVLKL